MGLYVLSTGWEWTGHSKTNIYIRLLLSGKTFSNKKNKG